MGKQKDDLQSRYLDAIAAARAEKTTAKKHKAFARVLVLAENPAAFANRPTPMPPEDMFDLYAEALQRGKEFDPELPEKPTRKQALDWLARTLGYTNSSTVRLALIEGRRRLGLKDPKIPGLSGEVVRRGSTTHP